MIEDNFIKANETLELPKIINIDFRRTSNLRVSTNTSLTNKNSVFSIS
jgi:hypothetical protein